MNIAVIVAVIAIPAATVVLLGRALPVKHVAQVRAVFRRDRAEVWRFLTDFESYPSWRRRLSKVEPTGESLWREVASNGEALTYKTVESVAPHRLVRRIANTGLPFGGTWTLELTELSPGATELSITEDGEIYNPIFRFAARFITSHHASMNAFIADAKQAIEEGVAIERV